MEDLNDCCEEVGLEDLKYTGNLYTWSRGAEQTYISRKLDRALVNHTWMSSLPEAEAKFLPPGLSDHSPIIINLGMQLYQRRTSFHYFNCWSEHEQFEDLISSAWQTEIEGTPMFQVSKKLKLVKTSLKSLNFSHYSDISNRASQASQQLQSIRTLLSANPTNAALQHQEQRAISDCVFYRKAEESILQ